jgi:hypothetical protein
MKVLGGCCNSAATPKRLDVMNESPRSSGMKRRHFLATTGLALAAPPFIPASALGLEEKAAPSERVTMGVVGWGMQGPGNTGEFLRLKDCQVVAACDLDKNHLLPPSTRSTSIMKTRTAKPITISAR